MIKEVYVGGDITAIQGKKFICGTCKKSAKMKLEPYGTCLICGLKQAKAALIPEKYELIIRKITTSFDIDGLELLELE